MVWPDINAPESQPAPSDVLTQFIPAPAGKKVVVQLMWGTIARAYQIKSISNTTAYIPGLWISPELAGTMCAQENWDVTIIEDVLVQQILSVLSGAIGNVTSKII